MRCRELQSSPFLGAPCASTCQLACNSCVDPCGALGCVVPLVGPTGPTGPQGPQGLLTPAVDVTAVFNSTTPLALAGNTAVRVPYNLVVSGNAAGRAAFDVTTGVFTVQQPGVYRIDFVGTFAAAAALGPGNLVLFSLLKNNVAATISQYQFPAQIGALCNNSVTGFWIGSFAIGDRISLQVTSSVSLVSVVGNAVSNVGPFSTWLTISALFPPLSV